MRSLLAAVGAVAEANLATVAEHERSEPCFETGSTLKASHALFLDAPPDLSERDNAQEQIG